MHSLLIKEPGGIDILAAATNIVDFVQLSRTQQQKLMHKFHSVEKNYHPLLEHSADEIDNNTTSDNSEEMNPPYLLLCITGEASSLADASSLLKSLKTFPFQSPVLIIVNMAANRQSVQATFRRFKTIINQYLHLQAHLSGYVLATEDTSLSTSKQQLVLLDDPDSVMSQNFFRVGKHILTSFESKNLDEKSPQDYFAFLTFSGSKSPVDIYESKDKKEVVQAPDVTYFTKTHCDNELTANSGLLQASYFARLLGREKNGV